MKKLRFASFLLAALMVSAAVIGCTGTPTVTTAPDTPTEPATDKETETETEEETAMPIETEPETYDPALDNSTLEKDGDGNVTAPKTVDPTLYVAIDGLGRELVTNAQTGDVRENKYVGIFYSSWHGDFANSTQAVNNQEILDKYPDIDINNYNDRRWSTAHYHFWNEPIYGYYSGNDEWVIRKQAELLGDAGVDCIICDNTNGTFTWMETAKIVKSIR